MFMTVRRVCPGSAMTMAAHYIQRQDDTEGVISDALATFDRQTEPLVEYFRNHGGLWDVGRRR